MSKFALSMVTVLLAVSAQAPGSHAGDSISLTRPDPDMRARALRAIPPHDQPGQGSPEPITPEGVDSALPRSVSPSLRRKKPVWAIFPIISGKSIAMKPAVSISPRSRRFSTPSLPLQGRRRPESRLSGSVHRCVPVRGVPPGMNCARRRAGRSLNLCHGARFRHGFPRRSGVF